MLIERQSIRVPGYRVSIERFRVLLHAILVPGYLGANTRFKYVPALGAIVKATYSASGAP